MTLVCYGGCLEEVEPALLHLFDEDELLCEVICPTQIYPLNVEPIIESVTRTGRVLVVEEGPLVAGFGAEVIARLLESDVPVSRARRLGYGGVIPACLPLELALLPNTQAVVETVRSMVDVH